MVEIEKTVNRMGDRGSLYIILDKDQANWIGIDKGDITKVIDEEDNFGRYLLIRKKGED